MKRQLGDQRVGQVIDQWVVAQSGSVAWVVVGWVLGWRVGVAVTCAVRVVCCLDAVYDVGE